MRVIVVRHHEEDSAGFIADAFASRGAELAVHMFPKEGALPEPEGLDHVVLLGATSSVYSGAPDADWIAEELDWLRRVDEAGVAVLGICFGAQALAAAFGGRVEPAARKEIGWTVVDTLDPALVRPARGWSFTVTSATRRRRPGCWRVTRSASRRSRSAGTWPFSSILRSMRRSFAAGWTPAGGPRRSGPGWTRTGCWPRRPPRSPAARDRAGWSRRRCASPLPEPPATSSARRPASP